MSVKQGSQQRKRLGDILVEAGLINSEQLQEALSKQKILGKRLGNVLIETGLATEDSIATTLARQMNIPYLNLNELTIPPEVLTTIPDGIVRSHNLIPVRLEGNRLQISMVDPLDVFIIDEINFQTGYEIDVAISAESQVEAAIRHYYGNSEMLQTAVDNLAAERSAEVTISDSMFTTFDIGGDEQKVPIINLVNTIIQQAINDRASDIHIEPDEELIRVRYRIDGILNELMKAPKSIQSELLSRLKIMAQMDISEKRLPQDGRIKVKVRNKSIDLRVSSLPTVFGEKIVIRILDNSRMQLTLDQVGFDESLLGLFKTLSSAPNGIVLMTGPTGSGKTSTLYAAINFIRNGQINITTVEDPVEYLIPSINQVQVRPEIGLTFARTLRSILRQDPNVILIGEIRDFETAQIAIESALTGHLVFSTLHTNDAASAVTRLIEMGVEPYLVASAVIGVGAQRLVRKICPSCRDSYEPDAETKAFLGENGFAESKLYRAKGCLTCRKTGYSGRTAIHEIMTISDEIHGLILKSASARDIRYAAIRAGMRTMRADGIIKAVKGVTTMDEVLRLTRSEDVGMALAEGADSLINLGSKM
ncbi:MAG: Type II secretion system protein E [bacterium ADurb.Bin157]|jgi:type IV pilus assembly protein PilB|nr:ATPase, T2SS/T4P/T4SS family [Candidatus Riflebacteria bacterium]NLV93842.1 Flp pilus assembly complex ATPase component TadA [Candidatus Riflebacteria bacterium]OQB44988.1 MAG: Type II secretion system protein E [bacterium ADurb.Bin157]